MSEAPDAIILVHGIGDQNQGSTLQTFLRLIRDYPGPEGNTQTLRTPPPQDKIRDFSYLTEKTIINGKPITIAEMHWSELSALETGFLSSFRNFFSLVVNAPDVVYASLGPRSVGGSKKDYLIFRLLRCLVGLVFWTIYFPITAYNIFYMLLTMINFAAARFILGNTLESEADSRYFASALVCIVLLIALARRAFLEIIRPQLFMAAACMGLILGLSASNMLGLSHAMTYKSYWNLLSFLGTAVWQIPTAVSLLYLGLLPVLIPFFLERWRGLLLGYAAFLLSLRFWAGFFTAVWLIIFNYFLDANTLTSLLPEFAASIRFYGLVWLDIAIFAATFAIAFLLHRFRSRAALQGNSTVLFPRLLVPSAVLVLPLAMSAVWLVALAYCLCTISPLCDPDKCRVLDRSGVWILYHVTWLLAVGGLVVSLARGGLKVSSDLSSYFRNDVAHRTPNLIAAMASLYTLNPSQSLTFKIELRDRFITIVEDLVRNCGPFRKLWVICHSLGSMIVLDAALSARLQKLGSGVNIIAMGSPYLNVFRYYFPHMFPELSREELPNVENVWNIYRSNDYVGTTISSRLDFITNRREGPKGHEGYFEDPRLLAELNELL